MAVATAATYVVLELLEGWWRGEPFGARLVWPRWDVAIAWAVGMLLGTLAAVGRQK